MILFVSYTTHAQSVHKLTLTTLLLYEAVSIALGYIVVAHLRFFSETCKQCSGSHGRDGALSHTSPAGRVQKVTGWLQSFVRTFSENRSGKIVRYYSGYVRPILIKLSMTIAQHSVQSFFILV